MSGIQKVARVFAISMLAVVAALAILPATAAAQNANSAPTLIINGQSTDVSIVQVSGRPYVDLAALASAANGSLSFGSNQIVLILPGAGGGAVVSSAGGSAAPAQAAPPAAAPAPAQNPGFSKGFLRAGIEQMATLREWHSALATAIQNGIPVTAGWLSSYRAQAAMNLRLASVAVQTDSDRGAMQLLNNEFQNMVQLADKYIAKRENMSYVSPDALQDDSLNQRIVGCGKSLAAMAGSGQFVDDGSCR